MDNKVVQLGTLISQAKTIRCGTGEYPILSMTMHDGLIFQEDKFKKVVASKDTSDYKVVYRNQLVISFPIDEGVLAAQRITDAGIVSPAYGIWDIDSNQVLPEYLEYALRCERAIDYYKAKLRGSTARRRSLPTPTLLEFTVPLPDIKTQQHILDVIHKTKDIIINQKAELQTLDNLIKARFVEMFNGKGYPEVTVHNVLETAFWLMPATPEFVVDGEIPYITSKNIKNRQIDFDNVKRISRTTFDVISANRPTMIGDILVSMIGTLGQTAVITDDRLFYGQNLYLLRLNDSVIDTDFFCEFFNSNEAQHILQSKRNQSTQAYLKANHVEDLILPFPPLERQKYFAAFVHQVDKSKFAVQKALEKAQLLFDSLMQKYFG